MATEVVNFRIRILLPTFLSVPGIAENRMCKKSKYIYVCMYIHRVKEVRSWKEVREGKEGVLGKLLSGVIGSSSSCIASCSPSVITRLFQPPKPFTPSPHVAFGNGEREKEEPKRIYRYLLFSFSYSFSSLFSISCDNKHRKRKMKSRLEDIFSSFLGRKLFFKNIFPLGNILVHIIDASFGLLKKFSERANFSSIDPFQIGY